MKGALAILGVIVVGAATYFIARGKPKTAPAPAKTAPLGQALAKQAGSQLATNLLTSQNMASLGGLLNSILPSGGSAKVAPVAGNGSGFVTEKDLQTSVAPKAPASAPVDNSFVVDLEDDDGYNG